jgi:hypothetical protein
MTLYWVDGLALMRGARVVAQAIGRVGEAEAQRAELQLIADAANEARFGRGGAAGGTIHE